MESKVQKAKKNADIAEENDGVTAEKIKFPLYVFPETMKLLGSHGVYGKGNQILLRLSFAEQA